MAPSYEQNTAKIGESHGTVNLGFKRPVHEGYMDFRIKQRRSIGNYTVSMFHCLQRGRFCPEALRAAQYVLRVLLHNTQHAQHAQNANNTRITRRTRSTAF